MSRRIAHRPRYRNIRNLAQSSQRSRQDFLRTRWTYHRKSVLYEKRPLGYGLSLIPFGYRFVRDIVVKGA